ncbi:MAG: hypothetical protein ACFFG0_24435 [Candidatus Thorarchaeota archaeon]
MEPCEECLVKACCKEVCIKKINHYIDKLNTKPQQVYLMKCTNGHEYERLDVESSGECPFCGSIFTGIAAGRWL